VAGTALLASLLVGILLSAARLREQAARSQMRLEACRAADALLASWWTGRDGLPRSGEGATGEGGRWRWRVRSAGRAASEALGSETIALELAEADRPDAAPVVRVEWIVPERSDADEARNDAR
jgi:hypothetical protein